ncbi:polysaccharide biosynthesis/export family protein [Photobacterium sp. BZF1]|uniref:XrtA/PEP-CTERM system exopolysaccharide export protein n=1 Tax=Photobacterium sp. BZF1 TaxID=1904457 RepID=UPI001653B4F8|nr:XrtA/PEP-CTERM system exopolysaccharide export protein [Photobacterium sp. BZF1]MBC7004734.1 polysaccharide biosynthesis/export family protein [Photobacterium sp. BZF1]
MTLKIGGKQYQSSKKNQNIIRLFLACFLVISSGCATNDLPKLPSATVHPSLTKDINNYSYLIGPGDSLDIFVWRNPEASGTYTVRPDGKINTALVDDLAASGKTPTELAREVEQVLKTYIKEPVVSISVGNFVGPYSEQVRVLGEAVEPQAINYKENMTLFDVMIEVGGLTEYADGNNSRLIRVINNQQKQFGIRMDDLLTDGDIQANVDILPGDIIIIPEAWF